MGNPLDLLLLMVNTLLRSNNLPLTKFKMYNYLLIFIEKSIYFRYFDILKSQISWYRYYKNIDRYRYFDTLQQPSRLFGERKNPTISILLTQHNSEDDCPILLSSDYNLALNMDHRMDQYIYLTSWHRFANTEARSWWYSCCCTVSSASCRYLAA